jgi:1-acyl-sn-glycerol-3-phosphate acyltransferase
MARKILGNDPFTRGAAVRAPVAAAPPPRRPATPAAPGKKPTRAPPTPELQTSTSGKRGPSKPVPTREPRANPASPVAGADPVPHAEAPAAVALGPDTSPQQHPGSPSLGFEPVAHAGAPVAAALHGPVAHESSPRVSVDPVAHAGTPTAEPLGTPRAHAGSPELVVPSGLNLTIEERLPLPTPLETAPVPAEETAAAPRGFMNALRGLGRAVQTGIGWAAPGASVDAWGKDHELSRSLRPVAELLFERYWRVQTSGFELLPAGPCLLVANHAGALPLDGPVLHHALRRQRPELREARWLLEDQVFFAPFVGTLVNRLGAVRASPENALRLLAEQRPLIVFPEGIHGLSKPFSARYQLQRFGRGGYVKIAARAGVPIVPVAIVGGEESMPLLARLPAPRLGVPYLPLTLPPLPARWEIQVGPPIHLNAAQAAEHDPVWVEQVNDQVRTQLQGMLQHLVAQRPSVF